MKRYLFCMLAIVAIVSCIEKEEEGNSNPTPSRPETEIRNETATVDFATEGGSYTISFSSTEAWSAAVVNSRADEWVSIYPTEGEAGDATITVTTQPNDTPDDRSATIVIKAGTVSENIVVSQKQKDALTVTASKFEVAADGGEINVEVKANISFEYTIEETAKGWVKDDATRALETSTVTFFVAENDSTEKREAKIYITSGEFSEEITIYQSGTDPSIVISRNEYVVSSDGETIAVEVSSNVDVAVELPTDADWISENKTRGVSTNTYYFDIAHSEEYDQRTAEIMFTNRANNLSESVKIVQVQKDALVVAKDSYTINNEGGQIQIEVGHNVDFNVEMTADWITKVENRAFTTEILTFNVDQNPTHNNRECAIIFESKDGSLTQIVKVFQAQKDAIIVSNNDIVVSAESGTVSFELQTNVEFKVSAPDVSWLRAVQTRGLTTHTLHYEYDANTSYDSREAQIVVTDTKNNKSETITITQAQKDAIIISNKYINVEKEGETIEVKINANVDFEIQIPSAATWISQVETRALEENSVYLKVLTNTGDVSRNANVTIINRDCMLSDTLVIIQQGNKTSSKIAYSESQEELEGWSAGLFAGEGTYIMGKPHKGSGYIMTIGNILDDNSAIVYIDEYKRMREIFIDNSAFVIEYNSNGGVDISVIESGREIVTEHIAWDGYQSRTRSSGDHSQQVGIINLLTNLQGMYDATQEIAEAKGFSKKGVILYLANTTDAIRNVIKSFGGPDIFNENFSNWLGAGMNITSLAELVGMYGSSGLLGPIGAFISAYAGLYTTYLELYDEHIEAYFGNCQAGISKITCKENKLNIDVNVSGYEPYYSNVECGVIVQEKSIIAPRYTDGASIKPVTQNGIYPFTEGGIKINTTYSCRPFLIDKNRVSLWKGFIGDIAGPLVRYGKVQNIEVQCSVSTGECVSVTETSAVVKCSYTNVSGLECGVYISSDDETKMFTTSSMDGEREINLSGLRPATIYNYWAFVNVDGVPINGPIKSFTTALPDVTGTWNCKETRYKNNGEAYYTTYTVTLHKDGTVTTSKYDSFAAASWRRSRTGLVVNIAIISTQYSDAGYTLSITFDDPSNPTSGEGYAESWAYSSMTGGSSSNSCKLEMSK